MGILATFSRPTGSERLKKQEERELLLSLEHLDRFVQATGSRVGQSKYILLADDSSFRLLDKKSWFRKMWLTCVGKFTVVANFEETVVANFEELEQKINSLCTRAHKLGPSNLSPIMKRLKSNCEGSIYDKVAYLFESSISSRRNSPRTSSRIAGASSTSESGSGSPESSRARRPSSGRSESPVTPGSAAAGAEPSSNVFHPLGYYRTLECKLDCFSSGEKTALERRIASLVSPEAVQKEIGLAVADHIRTSLTEGQEALASGPVNQAIDLCGVKLPRALQSPVSALKGQVRASAQRIIKRRSAPIQVPQSRSQSPSRNESLRLGSQGTPPSPLSYRLSESPADKFHNEHQIGKMHELEQRIPTEFTPDEKRKFLRHFGEAIRGQGVQVVGAAGGPPRTNEQVEALFAQELAKFYQSTVYPRINQGALNGALAGLSEELREKYAIDIRRFMKESLALAPVTFASEMQRAIFLSTQRLEKNKAKERLVFSCYQNLAWQIGLVGDEIPKLNLASLPFHEPTNWASPAAALIVMSLKGPYCDLEPAAEEELTQLLLTQSGRYESTPADEQSDSSQIKSLADQIKRSRTLYSVVRKDYFKAPSPEEAAALRTAAKAKADREAAEARKRELATAKVVGFGRR